MAQHGGTNDPAAAGGRTDAGAPDQAGAPLPGRPPRPQLSDRTPPPIGQALPPTGMVKAARSLWLLSFLLGAVAIAFAYLSRDHRLERLREIVAEVDPAQDEATVDAVAALVHWGSLGALALIIVVEALLLRGLMRRRGGIRWVQLVVLLIHGGAAVLTDAFLVAPGEGEMYLRWMLVAQLVLASAALLVSLLPGADAWFRAKHETYGRPRG
ncbi:hypothetical protein [Arthrobacter crystallopoietes]|uniref:hypothetical protein n=1 Tax=Crystallibacter crystallopoietes TaxID=37928 RepID=UPI000C75AC0B|nr:hypothetical protein [Arthrobacter crystallopoietes]AUI50188.1 hypothetical protein AC20117_04520 [Arthrobacter crystallopoietes]